jgi:hypothetical protein
MRELYTGLNIFVIGYAAAALGIILNIGYSLSSKFRNLIGGESVPPVRPIC